MDSFMEEKKNNDKIIDEQLDIISKNLDIIKTITTDINVNIDIQNNELDDINIKTNKVNQKFNNINRRIRELFNNAGGCSTFIPCVILSIIIIGIIGYIITIAK